MSTFHYAIRAEAPKFIPVADKPLNLGGRIERLSVEEFQARVGFIYDESISIDIQTKIKPFNENITGDVLAPQLKKQVEKVLKASCANLAICNMGNSGYGVFATQDIPRNTVVAVYAGTLIIGSKTPRGDHASSYYGTNMSFSTKNYRGIASFIQHLPEEPRFADVRTFSNTLKMFGQNVSEEDLKLNVEFYSTEFDSAKTRALVATENIRKEYLNFNNVPLIAMVTNKDIKFGDQLGFNYGYRYWLSRNITPEFFDKNGNALSHRVYKRIFGQLNFGSFSYTGEYKPLVDLFNKGKTSVIVVGDDKNLTSFQWLHYCVLY